MGLGTKLKLSQRIHETSLHTALYTAHHDLIYTEKAALSPSYTSCISWVTGDPVTTLLGLTFFFFRQQ